MHLVPIAQGAPFKFLQTGEELQGPLNGANAVFTTSAPFVTRTLQVFWNGRYLTAGMDFLASEGGGAGTGYNTITLLWTKGLPVAGDSLRANYVISY